MTSHLNRSESRKDAREQLGCSAINARCRRFSRPGDVERRGAKMVDPLAHCRHCLVMTKPRQVDMQNRLVMSACKVTRRGRAAGERSDGDDERRIRTQHILL